MIIGSKLVGFGHYIPKRIVKNIEIEKYLGLNNGWIKKLSGILERRYVSNNQSLTDIAYEAGLMAIKKSGYLNKDFAMLLLATSTPDHLLPPSAPLLALKLGLCKAGGIDIGGACSGFLYALVLADGFVRTQNKPVLIVAANVLSKRINPDEIASAILFSDAAGAVVLAPNKCTDKSCILSSKLITDASDYDLIKILAGGSSMPFNKNTKLMDTRMTMRNGHKVFSKAIIIMTEISKYCLNTANIPVKQIKYFIPHQANIRIINKVSNNLKININRVAISLDKFGNSSSATIPLTLSIYNEKNKIKKNDIILMTTIGAGFIAGSVIIKI